MTRQRWEILAVALALTAGSGHIGSPDAWLDGRAGPYHLLINVKTPQVVPGVAEVFVRVSGDSVSSVLVGENYFATGDHAPPPEAAERVTGDDALYHAKVWVMQSGSNSINVVVQGARGSGSILVPVPVVATRGLAFGTPLAILLAAVAIFLFTGLISIMGAAVREGSLAPGDAPSPTRIRRARVVMGMTGIIALLVVVGGWKWWSAEDADFNARIFKPMSVAASVNDSTGIVHLRITDSAWIHRNAAPLRDRSTPMIPDHGKLMHMFVVSDDMNVFAHLHPQTRDSLEFGAALPQLPAGRYKVFADVTRESGFAMTLSAPLVIDTRLVISRPTDDDDSWTIDPGTIGTTSAVGHGLLMRWQKGETPLVSGVPAPLRFTLTDSTGRAVPLEPYMGMSGHAVILRSDRSVFIHLHPAGTQSMAAAEALARRTAGDSLPGSLARRLADADSNMTMHPDSGPPGEVSFPYAFPRAGRYRLWIQVRAAGGIHTGVFDANVIR